MKYSFKVALVFLQWLPWLLKMARPGEKITRKTIMMAKKMKELDIKETSSKSLLSNVLDMDDDFRRSTLPRISPATPHPSHVTPSQNNQGILRSDKICLLCCSVFINSQSHSSGSTFYFLICLDGHNIASINYNLGRCQRTVKHPGIFIVNLRFTDPKRRNKLIE